MLLDTAKMTKPIIVEMYLDFPTASRRARWIAKAYSQATRVMRCPTGWGVYVSKEVLVGLRGQRMWRPDRESAAANDLCWFEEQDADELFKEVMQELAEKEELLKEFFVDGAPIPFDDDDNKAEEGANEELNREILEENFSWERSGEDGWFYED